MTRPRRALLGYTLQTFPAETHSFQTIKTFYLFIFLINNGQDHTGIWVAVGGISWSVWDDDDGQHDEAEHEQKNDQVEHDQEPQEGEVGQNSSSKSCWNQKGGKTR